MRTFFQSPPELANQYDSDRVLRTYLERVLPVEILREIEPDLRRIGERTVTDIYRLGQEAEASPPLLISVDPWGQRIDSIKVSYAWEALDRISAEEKLVAIGYERKQGEYSRVYQFAKLYLFGPSSAIYTCPLAMTDGAARAIELYGDDYLKEHALPHLISSNPKEFWTSGQWMTERTGGSDVSGTTTVANPEDSTYRLYGDKWFTSATTSQIAMTLARIEGAPEGSRGLSLFYLELRDRSGKLNHIRINRLKIKLGTRALPTAELTLEGSSALLVGSPGDGVKKISSLFNITRIYNACSAVGYMRRAIALARDYATKRKAFGAYLSEHGLHLETLAHLQVEFEAAFHMVFHTVQLLGKVETGVATLSDEKLLRLLTPLIKLYTAKQAISVVSETLEAFGGAGYIEDTGLPQLLRDVQVLSIWEGTTNILSLDALRAIKKEEAGEYFLQAIEQRLSQIQVDKLIPLVENTRRALNTLKQYLVSLQQASEQEQQVAARKLAFSLIEIYTASLLLENAQWTLLNGKDPLAVIVANRWSSRALTHLSNPSENYTNESREIALDSL